MQCSSPEAAPAKSSSLPSSRYVNVFFVPSLHLRCIGDIKHLHIGSSSHTKPPPSPFLLQGEAADSIRNAYMNVADKYQDVLTLEASVAELHQMFLDFALLTEKQGELLDQIEHQVKEASDYIDQGNTEMVEAIEIQKSIRAKQCCIALIVLVVLGVIIGIIAAKVTGAF